MLAERGKWKFLSNATFSSTEAPLIKAAPIVFFYGIFSFFKGNISSRGISAISFINAPKWRQSAEMEILEKCNVFEYGGAFNLNSANSKKNNKVKKQILKCLPNLQETMIEVSSFHSICLKIGVNVKRSTL